MAHQHRSEAPAHLRRGLLLLPPAIRESPNGIPSALAPARTEWLCDDVLDGIGPDVYSGGRATGGMAAMIDLLACVSQAADLIDPALVDHHKEVAVIAGAIAREMGVAEQSRLNVVGAALVHDIGALSVAERLKTTRFDYDEGFAHSEPGYLLLRQYAPFEDIARIVRVHHAQWRNGAGAQYLGEPVPVESLIIHVADRVAVLVDRGSPVLDQHDAIVSRIAEQSGSRFLPEAIEAFVRIARDEAFWLDIVSASTGAVGTDIDRLEGATRTDWVGQHEFAGMISRIVDFRSAFTATHTSGVASTVMALGRSLGMDEGLVSRLGIAGDLHDVGKLAVPTEILEKPGPLDAHEWAQMKAHTYYTYKVLMSGGALSEIAGLAAYHHERLDGTGYPFHIEASGLDEGARLMAVADIFTAVSEDRPYRKGMTKDAAISVLREAAERGAIDPTLVEVLVDDFEGVDEVRLAAQAQRQQEFADFRRALTVRAQEVQKAGRGIVDGLAEGTRPSEAPAE